MRSAFAVAVVALLIAACARDDQLSSPLVSTPLSTPASQPAQSPPSSVVPSSVVASTAPATTAPPSTAPPTTAAVAATAAPAPIPSTVPAETPPPTTAETVCVELPAVPADAVDSASAALDVDADGAPDTVRTYSVGAAPAGGSWHLRVELATGQGADLTLPDDPAPAAAKVLGAAYIGSTVDPGPGGMRPAIFVTTGAGASTAIVSLFRFDGCELVTMGGGPPFPVGAAATHAESLRCEGVAGESLLAYRQVQLAGDGVNYEVIDTGYTRTGNSLSVYGAGPITTTEPTMPVAALLIDCPSIAQP